MKAILISLFISISAFADISGNTFSDPKLGFSIKKPASWEFAKVNKSYGIELKSGMTSEQGGIIVSFAKPMPTGFFGIKPSVGVTELKLEPKESLSHWLNDELDRQKAHDNYFVQVSGAIETTIQTHNDASRIAFLNSTRIDNQQVRVYHAIYLVRHQKKVFLINMNCNDELANESADAFSEIAGSIHLSSPSKH